MYKYLLFLLDMTVLAIAVIVTIASLELWRLI